MSNPDTAAAHEEFPDDDTKETSTEKTSFDTADYEKQVVDACNKMEFGKDGKWVPPEGMSPEMQFAVNSERRRRDTQASLTKSRQVEKVANAKVAAVTERLENSIKPNLTVEQAEELEDLKANEPDKWREKLNEYDADAYARYADDMEKIDSTAAQEGEAERRVAVLEQFNSDNPGLELNDHVFVNDLPQRITGKLKEGGSFEDFLEEAKEYLTKGKTIASADAGKEEPDLGKSGGTSKATDTAVEGDINESYKNEIF